MDANDDEVTPATEMACVGVRAEETDTPEAGVLTIPLPPGGTARATAMDGIGVRGGTEVGGALF